MTTIVTRVGKGSALTFQEGDANFTNLNTDKIELANLSAGTSGDGSLTYNNTTGQFTYAGPGVAEYRGAFSAGTGITVTAGVIASTVSAGIGNVVEDTTPQLGGELDGQGNTVTNVNLKDYKETNFALTYAATITPDVANGNVQTVTLTGAVTFSAFANPEAGQTVTLIIKQDATGSRTLTSTMKFAGGNNTLTTDASAVDIVSVFFDGTNYYASLATDFK